MSKSSIVLFLAITLCAAMAVAQSPACPTTASSIPECGAGGSTSSDYPCCYINITPPTQKTGKSPSVWVDVWSWGGSGSVTVQRCTSYEQCGSGSLRQIVKYTSLGGINKAIGGGCDGTGLTAGDAATYLVTFADGAAANQGVATWAGNSSQFDQVMVGLENNQNVDKDYNDVLVTFSTFQNSADQCSQATGYPYTVSAPSSD
ncbi:MAG: hypothetical protein AAGD38_13525 [Acidobacteriota bacterium]